MSKITLGVWTLTLLAITSAGYTADAPDFTTTGFVSPPVTQVVDLSNWTYYKTPDFVFGVSFPGDSAAQGAKLPDAGMDGSVNDLELNIGDLPGQQQESLQTWFSPIGLIPFHEGSTYRMSYTIRESRPVSGELVLARARWGYGTYGRMGSGGRLINSNVARPASDGTVYSVVFDTLDIASANNPAVGDLSVNENDITLQFDAIDLFTGYQGAVALENVAVVRMETNLVKANQTLMAAVSDFTTDTTGREINFSNGSGSVTRSENQAMLTTSLSSHANGTLVVYGSTSINLLTEILTYKAGAPPQPSGLIYRSEFDVEMTNDRNDSELPPMVLRTRTTEGGIARDTTETYVNSRREDGSLNPAYTTGGTYSAYHHFPDDYIADGISGSGFAYGDGIEASIALEDMSGREGGTILVTGIRIYTVPEAIFP